MQRLLHFKPANLFLGFYHPTLPGYDHGTSSNAYIGEDGLCRLKLSNGQETFIDMEDLSLVIFKNWTFSRITKRNPEPYISRSASSNGKNKTVLLHRVIMNAQVGQQVDHINTNTLDNRRSNLRFCTGQQNIWNKGKFRGAFSSKYKGVVWDKEHENWRARIRFNNKLISLGRYSIEEDAAKAYDKKALELFGEFAKLNFPSEP